MEHTNELITLIGGLGWLAILVIRQHLYLRAAK